MVSTWRLGGWRVGVLTLVVGQCLAACADGPAPRSASAPVTPSARPTMSSAQTAEWVAFRQQFGLRWDAGWLETVAADPRSANDTGIPLLASELDLIGQAVRSTQPMISALTWYGEQHPDEYGGVSVEGRTVVIRLSDNIGEHTASLKALLGGDAPFEVRASKYSLRQLEGFAAEVQTERSWFESIGASLVDADPAADRVRVRYRSRTEAIQAAITEHFGSPDWLVLRREGPQLWNGPTGAMLIRALDADGRPVMGLDCHWTPIDSAVDADTGLAFSTDVNGECRNDYLPATMYRVSVTRYEDGAGNVEVGAGQGSVPADGLGQLTISVSE